MECVNLKETFGKRFKIAWDESYYAERGASARSDDPWLQIIPCQHGHIYPYGGEMLVASTARHGRVAKSLVQLDCTTLYRDGDDGVDLLFHVDDFGTVAKLMKPRRRRKLSAEHRAKLVAAGLPFQKRCQQAGVETPSEPLERTIMEMVDPLVAQGSLRAFESPTSDASIVSYGGTRP